MPEPLTVSQLRDRHDQMMSKLPRPDVAEVRDLTVAGRPARLYRPHGAPEPQPALIFFHGGGWALGGIDSYDPVVRSLTRACDAAYLSVAYRRPPEHPHPAAVDDAVAAVEWIVGHAAELGLDPGRIGLVGESGGGQIALAAALRIAASGGPALTLLLLAYPAVDLRAEPPSGALPADLLRMIELYVGDGDRTSPEVSPLLAPDLSVLPPTVVATGEFDFLRGQIREFTARLRSAGVPTTLVDGDGLDHGFLAWGGLARRPAEAITLLGGHVRRALGCTAAADTAP
ncbi:alpha/beta hydrolase [Streptomyces sp. NPDC002853]